jgi:hypothetical protein
MPVPTVYGTPSRRGDKQSKHLQKQSGRFYIVQQYTYLTIRRV